MVRIERGHARTDPLGPRTEILFVDVTVIVDDEGHDAGVAILGGKGDEAEAANHVAAHDVVHRAAGRVRTLAGQDPEVVAVIRLAGADAIATLGRGGDRFAERAVRLAARGRPVQAILLARRADDLLRIHRLAILVLEHVGVLVLRVPIGEGSLERPELVTADAAGRDLLAARGGVEAPLTVALGKRYRERPFVLADHENRRLAALRHDAMLGIVGGEEFLLDVLVLHRIAGGHELLRAWPEYRYDCPAVTASRRGDERFDSSVGCVEFLLGVSQK